MIGQTVAHYRIIEKLGSGGMGDVFLAEDSKLKRKVALKFLSDNLSEIAEARARFEREARAQAALNHPNVVTVHDVAMDEGRPYIVMEFVDGRPLADYVTEERRATAGFVRLAIGIAEGLAAAHRAGVIHRDLKPSNILVDRSARARICDFGLATARHEAKITRDGSTLGTAAYMSPEQAQGLEVDRRSDIFSFGAVLYELLARRLPFPAEHESAQIYSIVNEPHDPLSHWAEDAPSDLNAVVERCLAKDPNDRYESADQLSEELHRVKRRMEGLGLQGTVGDENRPSIAVLPFTNMSADPDNEYFSDGLAEELLNALAKIPELHVAARTSSFAFKGRVLDIRDIGTKLNVKTVLEGSVRRAGNRLRITAQLINVKDGYHLWSERYDREMEDVFAIQDEISKAIVDVLKVKLVGSTSEPIVARPTDNVEAYNLYLRGRHFWSQRTEEGFRRSVECYEKAIELDPKFALAHVGLADTWSLLCAYHILAPAESIPQAQLASQQALSLNPDQAESYEARGHVRILDDWNWASAENEFRHAIAINPNYATAHQRLGLLLSLLGRFDEAWGETLQAQYLEPMSLIINTDVGLMAFIRSEYDEALRQIQSVLQMNSDFAVAHLLSGIIHLAMGDHQRGVAELHRAKSGMGSTAIASGFLGHAYARWGDLDEARSILEDLHELANQRFVSPYSMATIHLGLGDTKRALALLSKAVDERSVWIGHLHMAVDPRLDELRANPSFSNLRKRMNLDA